MYMMHMFFLSENKYITLTLLQQYIEVVILNVFNYFTFGSYATRGCRLFPQKKMYDIIYYIQNQLLSIISLILRQSSSVILS